MRILCLPLGPSDLASTRGLTKMVITTLVNCSAVALICFGQQSVFRQGFCCPGITRDQASLLGCRSLGKKDWICGSRCQCNCLFSLSSFQCREMTPKRQFQCHLTVRKNVNRQGASDRKMTCVNFTFTDGPLNLRLKRVFFPGVHPKLASPWATGVTLSMTAAITLMKQPTPARAILAVTLRTTCASGARTRPTTLTGSGRRAGPPRGALAPPTTTPWAPAAGTLSTSRVPALSTREIKLGSSAPSSVPHLKRHTARWSSSTTCTARLPGHWSSTRAMPSTAPSWRGSVER